MGERNLPSAASLGRRRVILFLVDWQLSHKSLQSASDVQHAENHVTERIHASKGCSSRGAINLDDPKLKGIMAMLIRKDLRNQLRERSIS